MRRNILPLLLLASLALTGCGVTGQLKTAPPIFGDKTPIPGENLGAAEDDDNSLDEDVNLRAVLDDIEG